MNHLEANHPLFSAYIQLIKNHDLWGKPLNEALAYIVRLCAEAMNTRRVSVWKRSVDRANLYCSVLLDNGTLDFPPGLLITREEHLAYFDAIDAKRIVTANDALNDAITASFVDGYLKPLNIGSMLDVSLLKESKTVGIVCIEDGPNPRVWTADEQAFASSIGDFVSQLLLRHELRNSEQRYRAVFDGVADAMVLIRDGVIVDCNHETLKLFQCEYIDILHQAPAKFWSERQPDGKKSADKISGVIEELGHKKNALYEWRQKDLNGNFFDSEVRVSLVELEQTAHYITCIRDISARKKIEAKANKVHALQHAVLNGAPFAIFSTDNYGIINDFNAKAERLLGYHPGEIIGIHTPCIFHDEDELHWRGIELSEELNQPIRSHWEALTVELESKQSVEHEWTYLTKQRQRVPVLLTVTSYQLASEKFRGYIFIASDLSDRKKTAKLLMQSKAELEYKASHDELTQLPNRNELHKRTSILINSKNSKVTAAKVALLLLDLDRFKDVNDALGHRIGDQLLMQVAHRLRALLSTQKYSLFRLGGDEFAVLMDNVHTPSEVQQLCEDIHACLSKPQNIDNVDIEVGASVGFAMYPDHGDNSHALLRCADVAMYRAKVSGHRTEIYAVEEDENSARRIAMMSELGAAIRNNELVLHYQPKVSLDNLSCHDCEALVRWVHPSRGFIPPNEFIPLAEMSELIHSLSLWVLDTAVKQVRDWQDQGLDMTVSINFSARNLVDATLPQHMKNCLEKHNVSGDKLRIEITETALMQDPQRVLDTIQRINALDVHFEIDDFGTGYSSLSHLKRLPIKTLKIDRTFIKDLLVDEQDHAIVRSTLDLAHSFGLTTVAEGVEDMETSEALQELGCDMIQGYVYSRPLPSADFEAWVAKFNAQ